MDLTSKRKVIGFILIALGLIVYFTGYGRQPSFDQVNNEWDVLSDEALDEALEDTDDKHTYLDLYFSKRKKVGWRKFEITKPTVISKLNVGEALFFNLPRGDSIDVTWSNANPLTEPMGLNYVTLQPNHMVGLKGPKFTIGPFACRDGAVPPIYLLAWPKSSKQTVFWYREEGVNLIRWSWWLCVLIGALMLVKLPGKQKKEKTQQEEQTPQGHLNNQLFRKASDTVGLIVLSGLFFLASFAGVLYFGYQIIHPDKPPTIEKANSQLIKGIQEGRLREGWKNVAVWPHLDWWRMPTTFKRGQRLYLRPASPARIKLSTFGSEQTEIIPLPMGQVSQMIFQADQFISIKVDSVAGAHIFSGLDPMVYYKHWKVDLTRIEAFGLFGLALLFAFVAALCIKYIPEQIKAVGDDPAKATATRNEQQPTNKPDEPEAVEAEELTEEEAREIMKTSNSAPGKLDSIKELHTVQDLLSQTVAEIEAAQNNPGKLTEIIRNKKTRFQDESWRKLVVSKLTKLETILAVKEVIIKDQELNRELGTAYLDDQIKIKEKENRLAELDAKTAELKKKARDYEKEDEEPIITPSKPELKGEKIRERLEEEGAMREEFRIELDKLIDEEEFREKRQEKWPNDEKNNSRLADIKNQIQKLEMKLKNL